MITSALAQWSVSGSVRGANSFSAGDPIRRTLPVGSFFTAKKIGSNSLSLNFNANVDFNNNVVVECVDLADDDSHTNSEQCFIQRVGKRGKLL